MKKLQSLALVLLAAISFGVSSAQTTAVNATVVDSDVTTWANGTWSISFHPANGFPKLSNYSNNGAALSSSVAFQSGTLNGSGVLAVTVYDSSVTSPTGSSWDLTICSNTSAPCSFYNFATAGASQDISAALTAIITAPRFKAVSGSYGYNDTEATLSIATGATYWNVTVGSSKCYTGSAWGTCSAAGTGTVTTFSAGTLSPLFTTAVANPTSTPALTFLLSNAVAHSVLGNFTGGSAGPTYSATPVFDITGLTGTCTTCTANAAGTSTTAANLAGGALGSAPYQSAAGTSLFIASPTTSGHTFVYSWAPSGSAIAPVALDLATWAASPPAIGGTTPSTGAFTTLSSAVGSNITSGNAYLTSRADSAWFAATGNTTAAFNFCNSGFANCMIYTTSSKNLTITGQYVDTVATGTPPFIITSTTTVPNLTLTNHPKVSICGTATTCSPSVQTSPLIQFGTVALTGGTATVASMTAYTSTTSFRCTASDNTTGTLGANAIPASTTSITVTGTATDTISYLCAGN